MTIMKLVIGTIIYNNETESNKTNYDHDGMNIADRHDDHSSSSSSSKPWRVVLAATFIVNLF
jgi:hypothetical protein